MRLKVSNDCTQIVKINLTLSSKHLVLKLIFFLFFLHVTGTCLTYIVILQVGWAQLIQLTGEDLVYQFLPRFVKPRAEWDLTVLWSSWLLWASHKEAGVRRKKSSKWGNL